MFHGIRSFLVVQHPGLGSPTFVVQARLLTVASRLHKPHSTKGREKVIKGTKKEWEKRKKQKRKEGKKWGKKKEKQKEKEEVRCRKKKKKDKSPKTNGESNTSNNQQTRINKGAFILTKRIEKKKRKKKNKNRNQKRKSTFKPINKC